jgi:hypothetical protein
VAARGGLRARRLPALLLAPIWLQGSRLPWGSGDFGADTSLSVASLLSGTANLPLTALFIALAAAGLALLGGSHPALGQILVAVLATQLAAIALARLRGAGVGVVLLRHAIAEYEDAQIVVFRVSGEGDPRAKS